jgi:hypothetical protein
MEDITIVAIVAVIMAYLSLIINKLIDLHYKK